MKKIKEKYDSPVDFTFDPDIVALLTVVLTASYAITPPGTNISERLLAAFITGIATLILAFHFISKKKIQAKIIYGLLGLIGFSAFSYGAQFLSPDKTINEIFQILAAFSYTFAAMLLLFIMFAFILWCVGWRIFGKYIIENILVE